MDPKKAQAIRAVQDGDIFDVDAFIKAAQSSDHPWHDDFNWNVEEAAWEHWRDQTRKIIKQYKFEVNVTPAKTISVPYYLPKVEDGKNVFKPITAIRKGQDVRDTLRREYTQLLGLATRVLGVAEAKASYAGPEAIESLDYFCNELRDMLKDLDRPRKRKNVQAGKGGSYYAQAQ